MGFSSLEFILNYNVPFIKIPSAHITNTLLIEEVAQTKIPVIISSGMSTLDEVDKAYEIIKKHHNDLVVMHCNSKFIQLLNMN